mgnify:CR=1 FL=1
MGKDNMMNYDKPFEENKLPFGSLEEEVADDIPVMLSEGEYVVPADVVRYWGLKHLEEMRMMAKCGLMSMQQDGRLHKVDEDGEPVETEAQNEPQLEIVEVDIQAMQDDMSDQEEEEENNMDKQMELFEDNVIEVDFDGKDEEDIEDDDNILKLQEGGGFEQQQNFGLGRLGGATLSISPDIMETALGNIGAFGTFDATEEPPPVTSQDVANALSATLSDPDRQKDLATEVVNIAVDEAVATQEPMFGSRAADKTMGVISQLSTPPGVPSLQSAVTGPSVTVAKDMLGNDISYNVGGNQALQAMAKAALTDLVDVGFNISKGVQDPNDLGVLGGQLVGVQVSDLFGIPTQSLTGTVPTEMSVADFDRAVAGKLGKDISTVGVNSVTGRPDYSMATDLIGVDRDPTTGVATTGGYTSKGDFQDMFGNVSAMGTEKDFLSMDIKDQTEVVGKRGLGGFFGIDPGIAAKGGATSLADQERDVSLSSLGVSDVADLEAQADKEKEQQEEEQQEMQDMMSEDETLGETEDESGPEAEE